MAEIPVSFLLEKLTSFLQNEVELLQGIPEDLEYIKDELQSLKATLRVADSAGEGNQELKHRIASKINGIKSRISHASARRPSFDNFGTNEQGPSSVVTVNPWMDRRGDALLLDSVDLVGIDKSKEQLIGWLVAGNSGRKVVSVVGMGGSGKTTLARQVYDSAKVKKHFAVHVWITVSHPFKIEELLRNMVRQLFDATRKPVPEGIDAMDPSLLKMIIKGFLQQRRYLIALDDVWHMNEWEMLDHAFANNHCGSCVLLTTRNSDVASTSCAESEDKVFKVEPLSPDESWTLFCKKCFQKDSCPAELESPSRRILEKFAKEQNVTLSDKVRRLAIHNTLANAQQNMNASHLRSLFVFDYGYPVSCSPTDTLIPSSCRLLKVLDLRAAPIQTFPEEISNLRLLRYLSLRDTNIKTIPSSIRKLQDLETLDLKHSQVSELPIEILKLQRLRHLLVYRYEFISYSRFHSKYGFRALSGIGALQSLQKLCFMDVNHDNALIMELGKLVQLRRLGITNLREEDGNLLCSSIEKLINLRALSIVSSAKEELIDLQSLSSPPQVLQRLYLYGRLEKLPDWIPCLQSLAVVYLKWSKLPNDALQSLQHLPNLVHLEMLQAVEGDTLCFKAGGFKGLKQLGIDKFEGLKCIEVEEGAMPCLEKLSIQRCKLLERVPIGIEYLTKLKVLEFFDMPEESIMTLAPDANIPEVYYTYWRNGEWEVHSLESSGEKEMGYPINSDTLQSRFK
ncbi:hypothetical protein V6N13_036168 [Hibiscus sabdariffa]